jgi:hypothetical protein
MNRRNLALLVAASALLAACGSSDTSSSSPSPAPTSPPPTSTPAATAAATGAQSAAGTAKLVIDPTHGKVGTVIHVTGSGYAPGIALTGALCAVDAQGAVANPLSDCDVLDVVNVTTDTTGGFVTTYTVKAIPTAKAGYQVGFGRLGDSTQSAGAVFTVDS